MGKSPTGSLADAIQLFSAGSCVSLRSDKAPPVALPVSRQSPRRALKSNALAFAWIEMLLESLPAPEVFALKLRRFQRVTRHADDRARLEHERHRVLDVIRLREISAACLLERLRIGPVPAHAIVQARAAGYESLRLGIVRAVDQPHELAGDIAMKPRRT